MVLLLVGRTLVPDGAFTPPTTAASRGSSGWLRSQPMNESSRTEAAKDHERTTRISSLLRSAVGDTALPHVGRTIVNRLLARSVALTRNEDLRDLRAAYRAGCELLAARPPGGSTRRAGRIIDPRRARSLSIDHCNATSCGM